MENGFGSLGFPRAEQVDTSCALREEEWQQLAPWPERSHFYSCRMVIKRVIMDGNKMSVIDVNCLNSENMTSMGRFSEFKQVSCP